MLTLYDAARCPFCARVRIVLAEKDVPHEVVAVDLDDRPAWIVEKNPPAGKVPVVEEDAGCCRSPRSSTSTSRALPGASASPADRQSVPRRASSSSGSTTSRSRTTPCAAARPGRARRFRCKLGVARRPARRNAVPHRPLLRAHGRRVSPLGDPRATCSASSLPSSRALAVARARVGAAVVRAELETMALLPRDDRYHGHGARRAAGRDGLVLLDVRSPTEYSGALGAPTIRDRVISPGRETSTSSCSPSGPTWMPSGCWSVPSPRRR